MLKLLLIGQLKELLHQLKIKDNVDHAGLLVQQEFWKDISLSTQVNYQIYQNNN